MSRSGSGVSRSSGSGFNMRENGSSGWNLGDAGDSDGDGEGEGAEGGGNDGFDMLMAGFDDIQADNKGEDRDEVKPNMSMMAAKAPAGPGVFARGGS